MDDMQLISSRPALRWMSPLALLLVVGGTGVAVTSASADPKLPDITAEQLLTDVQQSKVDGLSGTVTEEADLGLPTLPTSGGESGSLDPQSLLTGRHTLRVAFAGENKSRIALTDTYGEYDLIRNGSDLWAWSSKEQTATHRTVRAGAPDPADHPPLGGKTPQQAAQEILGSLEPSTVVSTDSAVTVAGRPAYELVLQPKDSRSLLTEARIAVDGETKTPLRVEVFGTDHRTVLQVAYTEVNFTQPADDTFTFTPPPGAKVDDQTGRTPGARPSDPTKDHAQSDWTKVGSGWTAVYVSKKSADAAAPTGQLGSFVNGLPAVSGAWGSGHLLTGTAVSAVLTDDGRIAVGSVQPDLLYAALK